MVLSGHCVEFLYYRHLSMNSSARGEVVLLNADGVGGRKPTASARRLSGLSWTT